MLDDVPGTPPPRRELFVKICGLRTEAGVAAAVEAGADAVGFIFHKPSRRFIEPSIAARFKTPSTIRRTGVFVNASHADILEAATAARLDAVQLHGDEGLDFAVQVAERTGLLIVKVFRVAGPVKRKALAAWAGVADGVLLDAYSPTAAGGTGDAIEHDFLVDALLPPRPGMPLYLAGGLTPETVDLVLDRFHPDGVDVSSGVEANGEKSPYKIIAFIDAARRWQSDAL